MPEKIPAGDYTVYCLLNNDIFLNPTEEKNITYFAELPNIKINIESKYNENTTDMRPIFYGLF